MPLFLSIFSIANYPIADISTTARPIWDWLSSKYAKLNSKCSRKSQISLFFHHFFPDNQKIPIFGPNNHEIGNTAKF